MMIINGVALTVESSIGINTYVKPVFMGLSVVLGLRAFYFKDKITQVKTLVGLSFLGNEVFLMLIPIMLAPAFLTIFYNPKVRRLTLVVYFFLAYCLVMLVATNVFDFSFFTIVFWFITFGSLLVLFIYYAQSTYEEADVSGVFVFFKRTILVQIPIMLLQAPIHRDFEPGDFWTGSSGNAVVVGFYFCMFLAFVFVRYFINLNRRISFFSIITVKNIAIVAVFGALMYFNDSKVIILVFGVGAVVYLFFLLLLRFLSKLKLLMFLKAVFAFGVIALLINITYIAATVYVNNTLETSQGFEALNAYTGDNLDRTGANSKYILYRRIYVDMLYEKPMSWLFGAGPGKFASKASNILAYDVLYKTESQLKLPEMIKAYSSPEVREYMADLWTRKAAETMLWRSSMLSMPFGGMVTMKAEYGFIGLCFFLTMVFAFSYFLIKKAFTIDNWKLKDWAIVLSITWFTLPVHMLFENYQDRGYIMIPLLTLTAVLYSMARQKQPNQDPTPA